MRFLHAHIGRDTAERGLPPMHPLTLRFVDREWDSRYRETQREDNLRTVRLAFLITIVINLVFVPQDLFFFPENAETIALVRALGVNGLFLAILGLSYTGHFRTRWPALLMLGALVYTLFQALANVYGGHPEPLDHAFIIVIFAIYALFPFFYIQAVVTALLATALFVAITLGLAWPPPDFQQAIYAVMLMLTANVIGLIALRRVEKLRRLDFANNDLIDRERARVRELLDRILPKSVAARLRDGESQVVEQLADVTVLFADVEGFTNIAAECAPEETLAMLSDTFERFDRLTRKHGVEKIKTIGDAYMVAAGAPKGSTADARAAAGLALDMLASMSECRRPDGTPLNIRIGMARGAIIAGVVGDSRFLYDLWGDAVNTASRMETTGAPGRIQVTREVVEALDGAYAFEARGEVEVKGKGMMPTWWLLGPVAASEAAD
jgi:class 3 adenylate cyclase